MPDYASEDFQWPEVKDLRPAQAGRLLDDIERESAAANKRADILKARKAQAKKIVGDVLEEYEQDNVRFTNSEGRSITYTPYEFDVFNIVDEEAFREWAGQQAERYYEEGLRKGIFLDEMRRRHQDGEPLPPGVQKFTDVRYSRSASKPKR